MVLDAQRWVVAFTLSLLGLGNSRLDPGIVKLHLSTLASAEDRHAMNRQGIIRSRCAVAHRGLGNRIGHGLPLLKGRRRHPPAYCSEE